MRAAILLELEAWALRTDVVSLALLYFSITYKQWNVHQYFV